MSEVMVTLTIQFTDGTRQQFEFPRQVQEGYQVATRIQQGLSGEPIMIELEDRIVVIPVQNIKMAEVSPPPVKLPANAVRNARLIPD